MPDQTTPAPVISRRLPIGAEPQPDGSTHVRVWAPKRTRVAVVLETRTGAPLSVSLRAEEHGYFSGRVADAPARRRYRFQLDDDTMLYPDPASRFQPEGPHGPSEIVDPSAFHWTDDRWRGAPITGQVLYEMHVGTFTPEGTWDAAIRKLPDLAALGVTCLELLPVADFPGRFGWGYDGVNLFAPTRLYGQPDDFRRFVDAAHAHGLAVILDVVYNHVGPDGNYLGSFSDGYVTDRYLNEWGEALNFDGPDAGPSREFFIANAGYWIDEYHLDGLRLDATQQVFDSSEPHVLTEIGLKVREMARGRATFITAENERQNTRLVRPIERGGYGLDALWNDDFHHAAMVALTGHSEAYYTDYNGTPQEFISAAKYGYLYQGQRYAWQKARRGTPAFDLEPSAFVTYIQNHDQVANTARGRRIHTQTSPGRYRAMTALLLLGPGTPMLFQGQEFAASSPFFYFCDHTPELQEQVRAGRKEFLAQFPSIAKFMEDAPDGVSRLADPGSAATFEHCKLDWSERERRGAIYTLHADLLRLRRETPAFGAARRGSVDGSVLGPEAFVLRFFATDGESSGDRLLIVNFGRDLNPQIVPDPLLAPPDDCAWSIDLSTEAADYGGNGTGPVESDDGWHIPGHAAVVLKPTPRPPIPAAREPSSTTP